MFDDGEEYFMQATVVAVSRQQALAEVVLSIGFDPDYLDLNEDLMVLEAQIIPEALLLEQKGFRMLPGFERIAQLKLGI